MDADALLRSVHVSRITFAAIQSTQTTAAITGHILSFLNGWWQRQVVGFGQDQTNESDDDVHHGEDDERYSRSGSAALFQRTTVNCVDSIVGCTRFCYQIGDDGRQNTSDAAEGGAQTDGGASAVGREQFRSVGVDAAQDERREELADHWAYHSVHRRICRDESGG